MDVKHIFLISLAIILASKEAQSLRRSLGSVFRRLNDCDGGNLIRINTNTCEHVINGKRQCKVLISGRTTNDSYTQFGTVKCRGKKLIQFYNSSITYSLKVVNETNVVFEEHSLCDRTTSDNFLFQEERNKTGVFTYKHISKYLGVSSDCTDRNLYINCTNKTEGRCFFKKYSNGR
ncbi:uncharacterized protein [Pocillopora verrucosa]|uniref:uncharacterized protein n=1 Tax=Pocillopora verrucosa TaxID=203993 RepID=UPI00333EB796